MDWKKIFSALLSTLKVIDWKPILSEAYKGIRPLIAKKVKDTESKIDDWVFEVADKLVLKFLGGNALDGEKERVALIDEVK